MKAERIQSKSAMIPEWKSIKKDTAITRTYTFPNFRSSLAFAQFVGELAEAANHHPDIDIRYNKVTLVLSTHDAGGLTEKDFDLAKAIDSR
jgi:4a-hydroxytetrahydrobiopterin dehydratase